MLLPKLTLATVVYSIQCKVSVQHYLSATFELVREGNAHMGRVSGHVHRYSISVMAACARTGTLRRSDLSDLNE
jgi:hypothetical protein